MRARPRIGHLSLWLVAALAVACRSETRTESREPAPTQGPDDPSIRASAAGEAETWGSLRVRRVGRGTGPVVILLHGFGAEGDDLVGLARSLSVPEGTRFVLPEAPLALAQGGRAWWPLDPSELRRARLEGKPRDLSDRHPKGLTDARRAVVELLGNASARLGVPPSELIVAGFSQGAMLALDVALHAPEPPAAVAVLSGAPLAMDEWGPRLERLRGVPVLVAHGRDDPLLAYAAAERLKERLSNAGAEVMWVSFEGGHTIPPRVRSRLGALVSRQAAD